MNPVQKAFVENVLNSAKYAFANKGYAVDERDKNMRTLAALGITWKDACDEVLDLTIADYFQGPSLDRDDENSDMYYMFKRIISGQVIYIKFKVRLMSDGKLFLKSFHFDGE